MIWLILYVLIGWFLLSWFWIATGDKMSFACFVLSMVLWSLGWPILVPQIIHAGLKELGQ